MYLLQRYGATRTITTKTGDILQTVTESNALALGVATGAIALISAMMTATLGHWYSVTADRNKQQAELAAAHAARTREQVAAVGADIASMLEAVRLMNESSGDASNLERAELWGQAKFAVRKVHNAALPHIGVIDDRELRRAADEVFEVHGEWYAAAEDALDNGRTESPLETRQKALDKFFEHARRVIGETEQFQN